MKSDDFVEEFRAHEEGAKRRKSMAIALGVVALALLISTLGTLAVGAILRNGGSESASMTSSNSERYDYASLGKECHSGLENHQKHVENIAVASRQANTLLEHPRYAQIPENITLHADVIAHNDDALSQSKEGIAALKKCLSIVEAKEDFSPEDLKKMKKAVAILPQYRTVEFPDIPASVAADTDTFRSSFNLDDFLVSEDYAFDSIDWTDGDYGYEYDGATGYDYSVGSYGTSSAPKRCDQSLRQQYKNEYDQQVRQLGLRHDVERRTASESSGSGGLGSQGSQSVDDSYSRESDRLLREYERKLVNINC